MKEPIIEACKSVYGNRFNRRQYEKYAAHVEENPDYIEDGGNMMDFVAGGGDE